MAQQPIDYSINLPVLNPAQSVMQGMAVGQGLLDARAQGVRQAEFERMQPMRMQLANLELADAQRKDQLAQQAMALDAAAREAAAVRAAQVAEARQRLLSGNPTADQIQRASVEFPELSASLKGWLETASDAEKQTRAQQANTGFSLLANGKSEEAASFYDAEAQKYEADGLGKEAQGMRNMAEMARNNPAAAQMFSGLTANALDEKWAENATKIRTMGAEVRKAEAGAAAAEATASVALDTALADIGVKNAQIERLKNQSALDWKRLKLDERKLSEETAARIAAAKRADRELSEKQQNQLADSAIAASTASAISRKAGQAAAKFEAAGQNLIERTVNTGVTGAAAEAINRAVGSTGEMTQARLDYAQLVDADIQKRAAESGNKLTDEDYRQQRALYPSPTGDFKAIAKWLRDQEASEAKSAALSDARAAWLGANGNLGPATESFSIGPMVIGRGDTFQDVVRQIDAARPAQQAPAQTRRSASGSRFTQPMRNR